MFTTSQLSQLEEKGINPDQVLRQLETFKKGISPVNLVKPALPNDGIEFFDKKEIDFYISYFQKEKSGITIQKFVPASGAASRMFKQLFEASNELKLLNDKQFEALSKMPEILSFINELDKYPFYEDLQEICKAKGTSIESLKKDGKFLVILDYLLNPEGLSYGQLPKGLLKFHKYSTGTRTAFEEHFNEASLFLKDEENRINLHFTVSPEHQRLFSALSEYLKAKYLKNKDIKFDISFSVQKPSTDTIAADKNNDPFLTENNKLLFRPGGHGALLQNMQELNQDLIFVGNIDNVAPDRTQEMRVRYKQLLAGVLLERVQKIHNYLKKLDANISSELKTEIIEFVKKYISEDTGNELNNLNRDDFRTKAFLILNRPIRICGMVKNVGEPGGGPFWVKDKNGTISKQIIESSQIDLKDPTQNQIFKNSSHFNPVDLVCYMKNYKNQKFNLEDFRDSEMAFISEKSQGSSTLKALELPGLWNGSMAGWISFFVDVPIETFSPVKTIFDLIREEHIS